VDALAAKGSSIIFEYFRNNLEEPLAKLKVDLELFEETMLTK